MLALETPPRRKSGTETAPAAAELARRSPWLTRLFVSYSLRHLGRHFHGVRVSLRGKPPGATTLGSEPFIVLMNHPSWWDALLGLALTRQFPEHSHFAPMSTGSLKELRFFRRFGFFGVEQGTLRGARSFLRQSTSILSHPRTALWITGQGTFVDPRERPVVLRPGVAHLAHRLPRGIVLPLAVEYPFWEERCPEALASFGCPIQIEGGPSSVAEWDRLLAERLEATQDLLAADARTRDPARFETIREGVSGVGGVYGLWRRAWSLLGGGRGTSALPGRTEVSR